MAGVNRQITLVTSHVLVVRMAKKETIEGRVFAYLRFSLICTISSGFTAVVPTPRAVP